MKSQINVQLAKPYLGTLEDLNLSNYFVQPKIDGIRIIAIKSLGKINLIGRSGKDLTYQFPEVVSALSTIPNDVILDGEIAYFIPNSHDMTADFNKLQSRIVRLKDIEKFEPVTFTVFDILMLNSQQLHNSPYAFRLRYLSDVLVDLNMTSSSSIITPIQNLGIIPIELQETIDAYNMEGLVLKRKDSPYVFGARNSSWLKFKRRQSSVVEVYDYTLGLGRRSEGIGALLIRDPLTKMDRGKVGTGWDDDSWEYLSQILMSQVKPIEPFLITVSYFEVTEDGKFRHPSYKIHM